MNTDDKKPFVELMQRLCLIFGKEYSTDLAVLYWEILKAHSLEAISKAATIHCTESRFFPKPADLIDLIPDSSGWLGTEEAWNLVPKDDYSGGYVTDEMMAALGAAMDSLDRADYIAARMAFKEAYQREVTRSKAEGRKPVYWYSGASLASPEQRAELKLKHVKEASDKGWLTHKQAETALLGLEKQLPPSATIQNLLSGALKQLTVSGSETTANSSAQ